MVFRRTILPAVTLITALLTGPGCTSPSGDITKPRTNVTVSGFPDEKIELGSFVKVNTPGEHEIIGQELELYKSEGFDDNDVWVPGDELIAVSTMDYKAKVNLNDEETGLYSEGENTITLTYRAFTDHYDILRTYSPLGSTKLTVVETTIKGTSIMAYKVNEGVEEPYFIIQAPGCRGISKKRDELPMGVRDKVEEEFYTKAFRRVYLTVVPEEGETVENFRVFGDKKGYSYGTAQDYRHHEPADELLAHSSLPDSHVDLVFNGATADCTIPLEKIPELESTLLERIGYKRTTHGKFLEENAIPTQ